MILRGELGRKYGTGKIVIKTGMYFKRCEGFNIVNGLLQGNLETEICNESEKFYKFLATRRQAFFKIFFQDNLLQAFFKR